MPEGDTVHRLAATMQPLVGATVEELRLRERGAIDAVRGATYYCPRCQCRERP